MRAHGRSDRTWTRAVTNYTRQFPSNKVRSHSLSHKFYLKKGPFLKWFILVCSELELTEGIMGTRVQ